MNQDLVLVAYLQVFEDVVVGDGQCSEGRRLAMKVIDGISCHGGCGVFDKDDTCQACGGSGNLQSCETCTYAYHLKCLLPPLKAPPPNSWRCPECVSPLNDIDKILDCEMRPTVADDSDASKLGSKQIFVKHSSLDSSTSPAANFLRVPEKEFVKVYKAHPRLRTKVNNFHRQISSMNNSEDDFVAIRLEWTTVDRILACRATEIRRRCQLSWKALCSPRKIRKDLMPIPCVTYGR
ncbi:unnamed protein product [Ilex paraguariensis]|uniref:PHD-type domain-containing protein n=1 Tax=Ilex paraguariensis TaxID=185542 RepID=A0ABC8T0P8_9AQUA